MGTTGRSLAGGRALSGIERDRHPHWRACAGDLISPFQSRGAVRHERALVIRAGPRRRFHLCDLGRHSSFVCALWCGGSDHRLRCQSHNPDDRRDGQRLPAAARHSLSARARRSSVGIGECARATLRSEPLRRTGVLRGVLAVQCRVRAMQRRASIGLSIVMALVLLFLLPYLFTGLMTGALAKLHISHAAAGQLVLAIILGGFINIPITRLSQPQELATNLLAMYGLDRLFPRLQRQPRQTVIAVNVGGCIIPFGIAIYQLSYIAEHDPELLMKT